MLGGEFINPTQWAAMFKQWLDFMLGPTTGMLFGALVSFVAVSLAGYAVYYGLTSTNILFGGSWPGQTKMNRVEFAGAGTVWANDRDLKEMLNWGHYQKMSGGREVTDTYASIDAEGNEQSQMKVTRWTSD